MRNKTFEEKNKPRIHKEYIRDKFVLIIPQAPRKEINHIMILYYSIIVGWPFMGAVLAFFTSTNKNDWILFILISAALFIILTIFLYKSFFKVNSKENRLFIEGDDLTIERNNKQHKYPCRDIRFKQYPFGKGYDDVSGYQVKIKLKREGKKQKQIMRFILLTEKDAKRFDSFVIENNFKYIITNCIGNTEVHETKQTKDKKIN